MPRSFSCPITAAPEEGFYDQIARAVACGYGAVELDARRWIGRADEARRAARDHGVAISAMWGAFVSGSASAERVERERAVQALQPCLDLVATLALPGLVFIDHSVPAAMTAAEREQAASRLQETLAAIAAHARSAGTRLLVEPLARDARTHPLVSTMAEAGALCEAIGEGLGICFDTYHLYANAVLEQGVTTGDGQPNAVAMSELLAGLDQWARYVGHVHVSDYRVRPQAAGEVKRKTERPLPGFGEIDFAAVLRAVHAIGYAGFPMVEGSVPAPLEQWEGLRRCAEYLQGVAV